MALALRAFMLIFLGFAFTMFGVIQVADSYPSPEILGRFTDALPTLAAVLPFAFGVLAIFIGLALLLPSLYRFRRQRLRLSPHSVPASMSSDRRLSGRYPGPVRRNGFDSDPDEYADDDYDNGAAANYASPYGNRPRDHRWASAHR